MVSICARIDLLAVIASIRFVILQGSGALIADWTSVNTYGPWGFGTSLRGDSIEYKLENLTKINHFYLIQTIGSSLLTIGPVY